MANGFRVNMEKLTRLVNDLDRAADSITDANNKLANARGRDLGSLGIDSAAEDFRDRWQDGIKKIAEGANGAVSVITNSFPDWERVCVLGLEIFDTFGWEPLSG
ncbi:hypothetical protein QFW96_02215 [Saccharopolyspora sp. TS4A08]|uniref:WXG100 family type VII secretion target n=1 Tax=Saccharopolyspora ipomoeae TaxID=3042027 RepID=A0ABT6PHE5_9PSEU|nr:hypothetical protein [Saccharopolyspora sp. TS4A08]MDI2027402.1 hypothetical protein [Saccharopolyspora sp. TS4A08]